MMRTEELLAACLDARVHGPALSDIMAAYASPAQRAEIERLIDLAARIERMGGPGLPAASREAMAQRIATAIGAPVSRAARDPQLSSDVHSLAASLEMSREDVCYYLGPHGAAKIGRFLDTPGYGTMFVCLRLFFRGVKRIESFEIIH
jgi:hypothetical protein